MSISWSDALTVKAVRLIRDRAGRNIYQLRAGESGPVQFHVIVAENHTVRAYLLTIRADGSDSERNCPATSHDSGRRWSIDPVDCNALLKLEIFDSRDGTRKGGGHYRVTDDGIGGDH